MYGLYRGEWENTTFLHPIGLAAVVLLSLFMLAVPRRGAIVPLLVLACFIPSAQRITLASLDFTLLRIVVLVGWVRLLAHSELVLRWRPLDTAIVLWGLSGLVIMTLQLGTMQAFVFKLGVLTDAVGMYFLVRCLIRDSRDAETAVRWTCLLAMPVAAAFAVEHFTHRNVFAIFGGVPEYTQVREGRLRCQGAFNHPILAGCFWAALVPLMAALQWGERRWRFLAVTGIGCSLAIIYASASSTPILGLLAACAGAAVFPLRRWLGWLRWAGFAALIVLHMVMIAPVWHLISRIDVIGGSTGWHRYHLIDAAIRHFGEWWLLGTSSTEHWGWGLQDVTNQYVYEGVQGGALTLILFVATIVFGFAAAGRLCRAATNRRELALAWGFGTGLLVQVAMLVATAYFGQIILVWYMTLAIIASLDPGRAARLAPSRSRATRPPGPFAAEPSASPS